MCQRSHHTLLHLDDDRDAPMTAERRSVTEVTFTCGCDLTAINPAFRRCKQSTTSRSGTPADLPDTGDDSRGYHDASKNMLDSGSSTSFIMKRLARCLQLRRKNRSVQIAGLAVPCTIPYHTRLPLESLGYHAREIEGLLTNPEKWKQLYFLS